LAKKSRKLTKKAKKYIWLILAKVLANLAIKKYIRKKQNNLYFPALFPSSNQSKKYLTLL